MHRIPKGSKSIFLFFLVLQAALCLGASTTETDKLVGENFKKGDFKRLMQQIEEGKVEPTYVFPGGMSLTEALVSVGEEGHAIQLMDRYWFLIRYNVEEILDAACLNDRYKVVEYVADKDTSLNCNSPEIAK